MMSRMLGAPWGAVTPAGKAGLDSLALRPITPSNGASGTGSTGEPPVGDFCAGLASPSCAMTTPPITNISAKSTTAMRHMTGSFRRNLLKHRITVRASCSSLAIEDVGAEQKRHVSALMYEQSDDIVAAERRCKSWRQRFTQSRACRAA